MALVPHGFGDAAAFCDLPHGAIFRTSRLPPHQVLIKAAGPQPGLAWMLLLGNSDGGAYPSPWYGALDDLREQRVFPVAGTVSIASTGARVDQHNGDPVFPGYLAVRPNGGMSVFIENRLFIDLATGQRWMADPRSVAAYDRWVIDVTTSGRQSTIMFYAGPMSGLVAR